MRFDIERTLADMHFLYEKPGWPEIPAVKNASVYVADGNQYFNRPGPRLVDSAEILAEVIHPHHFTRPQFRDSGWIQFDGKTPA